MPEKTREAAVHRVDADSSAGQLPGHALCQADDPRLGRRVIRLPRVSQHTRCRGNVDDLSLVTGAGRGIGRAIALKLAELGATVLVNYNGSSEKAKEVVEEIERNQLFPGSLQKCGVKRAADLQGDTPLRAALQESSWGWTRRRWGGSARRRRARFPLPTTTVPDTREDKRCFSHDYISPSPAANTGG